MPLQDYSYIAPVGFNCMPAWQLRREAQESGLARERVRGPFDWLILPLAAAVYAVETDFREFLRPETLALESDPGGDHWRLGDAQGVHAWHHVPRATGDISVTAASAWRTGMERSRIRPATCCCCVSRMPPCPTTRAW
jgi:hypothetical protein